MSNEVWRWIDSFTLQNNKPPRNDTTPIYQVTIMERNNLLERFAANDNSADASSALFDEVYAKQLGKKRSQSTTDANDNNQPAREQINNPNKESNHSQTTETSGPQIQDQPARVVDLAEVEKAADAIHGACDGAGTDEDRIHRALLGKSDEERAAIDQAYQRKYGMTLKLQFEDELSGSDLERAMQLLNPEKIPTGVDPVVVNSAANAIFQATDGIGTDEETILNTLKHLNERERKALLITFKETYGVELTDVLINELDGATPTGIVTGSEYDQAMRLLYRKDADLR
jgi:hypothetical protein